VSPGPLFLAIQSVPASVVRACIILLKVEITFGGHAFVFCRPNTTPLFEYITSTGGRNLCSKLKLDPACPQALIYSAPDLSRYGTRDVEKISDPEDGMWYPGSVLPQSRWVHNRNPFAKFSPASTAKWLTAKLASRSELQWAVDLFSGQPIKSTRGNQALAQLHERDASHLTKPQFLGFGAVRTHPLLQLRQLCVRLSLGPERLPLTDPAVHTLLQQTLYHVGELAPAKLTGAADGSIVRRWREVGPGTDVDSCLRELQVQLEAAADELAGAPSRAAAVVLVGEMAAHLSQFPTTAGCRAVARRLCVAAVRWADDLEEAAHGHERACNAKLLAMTRAQQVGGCGCVWACCSACAACARPAALLSVV
jgi:hypothetical protein